MAFLLADLANPLLDWQRVDQLAVEPLAAFATSVNPPAAEFV